MFKIREFFSLIKFGIAERLSHSKRIEDIVLSRYRLIVSAKEKVLADGTTISNHSVLVDINLYNYRLNQNLYEFTLPIRVVHGNKTSQFLAIAIHRQESEFLW